MRDGGRERTADRCLLLLLLSLLFPLGCRRRCAAVTQSCRVARARCQPERTGAGSVSETWASTARPGSSTWDLIVARPAQQADTQLVRLVPLASALIERRVSARLPLQLTPARACCRHSARMVL